MPQEYTCFADLLQGVSAVSHYELSTTKDPFHLSRHCSDTQYLYILGFGRLGSGFHVDGVELDGCTVNDVTTPTTARENQLIICHWISRAGPASG